MLTLENLDHTLIKTLEQISHIKLLKEEYAKCEILKNIINDVEIGKGNFTCIDALIYVKVKDVGETLFQLPLTHIRTGNVLKLTYFGIHFVYRKERNCYHFYCPYMSKYV